MSYSMRKEYIEWIMSAKKGRNKEPKNRKNY
jgi:hypothetical protein